MHRPTKKDSNCNVYIGRRDALHFLQRFYGPDHAPRVIIYDFACALKPYITKRSFTEAYANIKCVIDAFHSKNHKCDTEWHIDSQRDDETLRCIRTSIVESINSNLQIIKRSLVSSSLSRGILVIRHFHRWMNAQRAETVRSHLVTTE